MMHRDLQGTAALAIIGELPWKPKARERFLVLRVKNISDLVAKEGGAAGAFAQSIAPDTISDTVYSKIAAQLRSGFREKGVDTDIQVLQSPPAGASPQKDLRNGVLLGIGAAGLGWVVWKYLLKGLLSRSR